MESNKTEIVKDLANKKLLITRNFDAAVKNVWKAWTESALLDQWWAPKPWRTETKSMNFTEGGTWLYSMLGPKGERQWCRLDYKAIDIYKRFNAVDAFCDENGVADPDMPGGMQWTNIFTGDDSSAKVSIEILFSTEEHLEKIIEMGFKEGFTAAHGNLDQLLLKM